MSDELDYQGFFSGRLKTADKAAPPARSASTACFFPPSFFFTSHLINLPRSTFALQQLVNLSCSSDSCAVHSAAFCVHKKEVDRPLTCYFASTDFKLVGPSGRVPPIIRQGPANQTVSRGATAQLHCRVIGGPSVKISWEKDGDGLQGNKPRTSLMENGTLQITDIKVCVCEGSGAGGVASY